jgi:chemotaxis protein MotA
MADAERHKRSDSNTKKSSSKPDLATIGGLILAFGGIIAGLIMEGGKIHDVAQVTSALIVMGGTIGAVMITTPLPVLIRAAKKLGVIFYGSEESPAAAIEEIIGYATQARKDGIASLESQAAAIPDPFLNKVLGLAADGIDSGKIRDIMELEIHLFEEKTEEEAGVFEAAGGYAPTIGIIGAVLGLIQVMKNLANIEEVGRGIAVAFVATIYGVASANILFLPAARKLKARGRAVVQIRELILEGVLSIAAGMNQKLIRMKLEAYLGPNPSPNPAEPKSRSSRQPVPAEG